MISGEVMACTLSSTCVSAATSSGLRGSSSDARWLGMSGYTMDRFLWSTKLLTISRKHLQEQQQWVTCSGVGIRGTWQA